MKEDRGLDNLTEASPRGAGSMIPAENISVGPFGSDARNYKILQGKPIHGLASASNSKGMQIDAISRTGTINSDGVIITVDEEALTNISAQTFKVLIILLTKATGQLPKRDEITAETILRNRAVRISLDEYMKACKIKDIKTAREQLNSAATAFYGISLEWEETEWSIPEGKSRKKKVKIQHRMRLTDHTLTKEEGKPVRRGEVEVRLSFDMAAYLAGAYLMYYPSALLAINTNNHPNSIPLGWKLCALYNMDYDKPYRGRTTVETLLRAAKGIPRYETIAKRGNIFDKIINPFDRDMQALVNEGILSYYYYETVGGERIESWQLGGASYTEFSSLYVYYAINSYPDQTPRIETKQKRIKEAKRAAARRGKIQREQNGAEE